jgi:hypothetical protein
MKNPVRGAFVYLALSNVNDRYRELLQSDGSVMDFYVNATEQTLVVKYNPDKSPEASLVQALGR